MGKSSRRKDFVERCFACRCGIKTPEECHRYHWNPSFTNNQVITLCRDCYKATAGCYPEEQEEYDQKWTEKAVGLVIVTIVILIIVAIIND